MAIEKRFDVGFMAKLTAEEKQIQQNYRPVIGVHKWFARRPGSLFRGLLVSEFGTKGTLPEDFFQSHDFNHLTIADPFMGGGTTLYEANRLGCNVFGVDINPMAFWIVRQELVAVDRESFRKEAEAVVADVEREIQAYYQTRCEECGSQADVKYFLWVKTETCEGCGKPVDLFPGYLIAKNSRHTHFVLHCPGCKELVQVDEFPKHGESLECPRCSKVFDPTKGTAARSKYRCECGHEGRYPSEESRRHAPNHRLFGIEYNCAHCRPKHRGRWFKTASPEDLKIFAKAEEHLGEARGLVFPEDEIQDGDETRRLIRWGYRKYREMFNSRQLLSLGLLADRIKAVDGTEERHALATVFSDFLRYQNMLCRYDTYALKCQDIFSIHGFPVGLIQCENNVLGITRIGSGAFRHFVEKYDKAKAYCDAPFETIREGKRKRIVAIEGERIDADLVKSADTLTGGRKALLGSFSVEEYPFPPNSLDGVFTDPPYFDNVQYAELMDFCYVWLKGFLKDEFSEFSNGSTRSMQELTGNRTLGRGREHFADGLSRVYTHTAKAMKRGAPFVFTYHHNDIDAYAPIAVALLDAGLSCHATLPAPAEMTASMHINGTKSSVIDSVFVCRREPLPSKPRMGKATLVGLLERDKTSLFEGGIRCTLGDLSCLARGHLARVTIARLEETWDDTKSTERKLALVEKMMEGLFQTCNFEQAVDQALELPLDETTLTSAGKLF